MKKQEWDKYYTNRDIALECIQTIDDDYDLWLEPSAGNGSFLHQIQGTKLGLDIAPDAEDVVEQDFYTWTPNGFPCSICTIGNPPFGANSKDAIAFFKRAAKFSACIAFIVPLSWTKRSVQNRLPLTWSIETEWILPPNIFKRVAKNGNLVDFSYPCVWQVWKPCKIKRRRPLRLSKYVHDEWEWCTRTEATHAVRRTGNHAGKIWKIEDFTGADQGTYFIKVSNEVAEQLKDLYEEFNKAAKCSAYPSLGKVEMIEIYIEYIGNIIMNGS